MKRKGHLDYGGQGEFWEADGAGLGVEVLQRQVIKLLNQAVLGHSPMANQKNSTQKQLLQAAVTIPPLNY